MIHTIHSMQTPLYHLRVPHFQLFIFLYYFVFMTDNLFDQKHSLLDMRFFFIIVETLPTQLTKLTVNK